MAADPSVRPFPAPPLSPTTFPAYISPPQSHHSSLYVSSFQLDHNADRLWYHHPWNEMSKRKDSITRLLPSTSVSRFGKEKGKEPLVISAPTQLPRRRASTVRVTSNEDPTCSEQHSPTSHPSTPILASAKLLRMTSKAGLRSLDTSSNASLRSTMSRPPGSPGQRKNSLRSKPTKPLKLDGKLPPLPLDQQPPSIRETPTLSYQGQFRRRRGDLLHRLGPSVPYMQAYDPTSLQ